MGVTQQSATITVPMIPVRNHARLVITPPPRWRQKGLPAQNARVPPWHPSAVLTTRRDAGRAQTGGSAHTAFGRRYTRKKPAARKPRVSATNTGWYGASAVSVPIHAPPAPSVNSTSGTMQHDDAASARSSPPVARNSVPSLRLASSAVSSGVRSIRASEIAVSDLPGDFAIVWTL